MNRGVVGPRFLLFDQRERRIPLRRPSGSRRRRVADADAPMVRISGHAMLASIEVEIDD
ncbi:hypothetical protein [Gaopeijia maritima]|uniref:Uncharacterized protein n=1 Tax=Gaopeijia maritima TaxID=3119007 RepID=A0ABU9ECB1_9BACT